jgi:hypothetical protein
MLSSAAETAGFPCIFVMSWASISSSIAEVASGGFKEEKGVK